MSWVKSSVVYTSGDGHAGPTVIFSGEPPDTGNPHYYPPFQWNTVDLKPLGVSPDAVWAEIAGHLIITHGENAGIANLTAAFRTPGSSLHYLNYQMQTGEPWRGGGQRDQSTVTIGLKNGCFEFYWRNVVTRGDGGYDPDEPWPEGSSYLLNLWLQKWGAAELNLKLDNFHCSATIV